mgnify:CR=1 FL=1
MTPCLAGHWSGLEDFPVYIQDGGVDAVLDVFFDLVKALGDLLGAGAQGGDGIDLNCQDCAILGERHARFAVMVPCLGVGQEGFGTAVAPPSVYLFFSLSSVFSSCSATTRRARPGNFWSNSLPASQQLR